MNTTVAFVSAFIGISYSLASFPALILSIFSLFLLNTIPTGYS